MALEGKYDVLNGIYTFSARKGNKKSLFPMLGNKQAITKAAYTQEKKMNIKYMA
jgi:hypothetical protein